MAPLYWFISKLINPGRLSTSGCDSELIVSFNPCNDSHAWQVHLRVPFGQQMIPNIDRESLEYLLIYTEVPSAVPTLELLWLSNRSPSSSPSSSITSNGSRR